MSKTKYPNTYEVTITYEVTVTANDPKHALERVKRRIVKIIPNNSEQARVSINQINGEEQ